MPCFFYVTNFVYMERKPETGKSTDKMENACYTSTIKANEKEIREETIMVIRLFCAAGMSTSLLEKKMEEAAKNTAGVKNANVNFMTLKMSVEFEEGQDPKAVMQDVLKNCKKVEDDCEIYL